jgi:hypothetical protein
MWKKVLFMGCEINAWICPADIVEVVWKVGKLAPGQVWGQIADDGPYRPVTLVQGD